MTVARIAEPTSQVGRVEQSETRHYDPNHAVERVAENAPAVRARICDGLEYLGVEIEEKRNVANAGVISAETSRIAVRVMHTDEEVMIAKSIRRVLGL